MRELLIKMRKEVLDYLTKENIDLSKYNAVYEALGSFESETIVNYMDMNNLELGYEIIITNDNYVEIEVWEW